MSFFAEVDNQNVVKRVIVADNLDWCKDNLGGFWLETSYGGDLRKQFANIGFFYDQNADKFLAPQPYNSWILDNNFDWQSPVAKPSDNNEYIWNESGLTWDNV